MEQKSVTPSRHNNVSVLRFLAAFVVISACVAGPVLSTLPVQEYFRHPFFGIYFKNLALNIQYALPGVFENNPYPVAVNGSLWSLPVKVTMYLVIPLLFSLIRYRKSQPRRFQIAIIWGICLALCVLHVVLRLGIPYSQPGLLIVSFLLTLAVALLSRSCIEQPCLKLSKQLLKRVSV